MKSVPTTSSLRAEVRCAKRAWPKQINGVLQSQLERLLSRYRLSVVAGDLTMIAGTWYVTHAGLLRLARRSHCRGIRTQAINEFCEKKMATWAFRAVVFTSRTCRGFVGYGDANPSNVSSSLRGAELRIAETRAVNRALRKAYGIGICSVEELGAIARIGVGAVPKAPARSPDSKGNGHHPAPRVRDRLCQIIRSYNLHPELVKAYAVSFCGTKTLREATRQQVEAFVAHLADSAEKDRNALVCQLNSFQRPQAGAA
jgi:hypothetical protein